MLTLDDFDYLLPPDRIAQMPLAERSASRLLAMRGARLADLGIRDLPGLLAPGDLLVMNDTRVIHARLYGRKDSGGQVEVLVERIAGDGEVIAQVRASKPPKPGSRLLLEEALDVEVLGREGEFYRLRFHADDPGDVVELIERHGRLPLPPYIERAARMPDEERYQTVFARAKGSVAAPTAGLHFDAPLLAELAARDIGIAHVTLHVGAGTFQPVRVHDLAEHRMHSERYAVPQATVDAIAACRARGGRVVAVGTTTLRTLESVALAGPLRAERRRERALHHARLPVSRRRCAADQLPSAQVDAADAGLGLRRPGRHPRRLSARHRQPLPLLQLRRRHADPQTR